MRKIRKQEIISKELYKDIYNDDLYDEKIKDNLERRTCPICEITYKRNVYDWEIGHFAEKHIKNRDDILKIISENKYDKICKIQCIDGKNSDGKNEIVHIIFNEYLKNKRKCSDCTVSLRKRLENANIYSDEDIEILVTKFLSDLLSKNTKRIKQIKNQIVIKDK